MPLGFEAELDSVTFFAATSQMNCVNLWSCSRPVEDSFGTYRCTTVARERVSYIAPRGCDESHL
jgi:hypothetical protein